MIKQNVSKVNIKFKMKHNWIKNEKVDENKGRLEVKKYPKNTKQSNQQQPKFESSNCPSCKRKI